MNSFSDLPSLRNRIVLVRVDFNGNHRDVTNIRFKQAASTVNYLVKKGARVVLLSHFGRPRAANKEYSMKPFAGLLSRLCLEPVIFIDTLNFADAREAVIRGKASIFLLENLRFYPGEEANDPDFAEDMASLGDFYVNDAFSVSHRKHASICGITRFIPSFAGPNLVREIEYLGKIFSIKEKPLTVIIGGAKIGDKLHFLKKILPVCTQVLLGGGPANTVLYALRRKIGSSIVDREAVSDVKQFLKNDKMIIPEDYVMREDKIMDIGQRTQARYAKLIKESRVVVWSGPMGNVEKKGCQKGTLSVGMAVAECAGFSVVGGGETVTFLSRALLLERYSFVSAGGSAMLDYLAMRKLPGIEALGDQSKV